ncbi:MAG: lipolytic protein [Alphaproteobacteria bacterium]|nr:lipolytic protein [Alphaproteobacteria bacterium]
MHLLPLLSLLAAIWSVSLGAFPAQAQDAAIRVAVLGDSLTAGYGLPEAQAFPARLEAALIARGHKVRLINAGVSGDTSAGGKARLDWTLADKPQIVIIELGANDAMRGMDPAQTEANLDDIVGRAKAAGAKVLLAGMLSPPNWGREYQQKFDALYPRLAQKHGVPLYPFFLDGVAMDPKLNQQDGIHPSAAGVEIIVQKILPAVEALVKQVAGS